MNERSNGSQMPTINWGILASIVRQARLAWRLLLDARVPLWTKMILPASLIYVVSPVDFIPDVIPGLGQLDDLAIVVLGVKLFIDLCPPAIVSEHLQAMQNESKWQVEPGPATASSYRGSSSNPDIVDAPYDVKKD